jgi:transcriptional regulator with XRE-family HTH domain
MARNTTIERSAYGERLYLARTRAKLSQPAFAAAAGIAQSTLSELERTGQGSAKNSTFARLTGVRAEWLETGNGPMLDTSEVPGQARQVASEKVTHYLVGTPGGTDYRTIALTLAAALEESGTQVTVQQFIKLLEATYSKLKPD